MTHMYKYSTQSLNIHKAIYMYIHVRVYLLHAYMHGSWKFLQGGWGPGPNLSRRGGGPIARNLGFTRVEGPDLLPPTSGSAHGLYAFVFV